MDNPSASATAGENFYLLTERVNSSFYCQLRSFAERVISGEP